MSIHEYSLSLTSGERGREGGRERGRERERLCVYVFICIQSLSLSKSSVLYIHSLSLLQVFSSSYACILLLMYTISHSPLSWTLTHCLSFKHTQVREPLSPIRVLRGEEGEPTMFQSPQSELQWPQSSEKEPIFFFQTPLVSATPQMQEVGFLNPSSMTVRI